MKSWSCPLPVSGILLNILESGRWCTTRGRNGRGSLRALYVDMQLAVSDFVALQVRTIPCRLHGSLYLYRVSLEKAEWLQYVFISAGFRANYVAKDLSLDLADA